MTTPGVGSDRDLAALLDEARAEQAALERSRRRWLHQQALEGATLAGLLIDLAEREDTVSVRTTSGRAHTGRVTHVGRDYVTVESNVTTSLVRLHAVAVVIPGGVQRPAAGGRTPTAHGNFTEALAEHAADRPDVWLGVVGLPDGIRGRLHAVGADLATVANDGGALGYVSLSSVTEASFLTGSG